MGKYLRMPYLRPSKLVVFVPLQMIVLYLAGLLLSEVQIDKIYVLPILSIILVISCRLVITLFSNRRRFYLNKWIIFWTLIHINAFYLAVFFLQYFSVEEYFYVLLISAICISILSQLIHSLFRRRILAFALLLVTSCLLLFVPSNLSDSMNYYYLESLTVLVNEYGDESIVLDPVGKIEEQIAIIADGSVLNNEISSYIIYYTNIERKKHGLSELIIMDELNEIASMHSEDMAENNFFSHDNLIGQTPTDRAISYGFDVERYVDGVIYVGIGENIGSMPTGHVTGHGYISKDGEAIGKAMVDMWMLSPGHRENILNADYYYLGVGVAYDGLYYIGTQNFW